MGSPQQLYPLLDPSPEIKIAPDEVNSYFAAVSTRSTTTALPILPLKPLLPWDTSGKVFQFIELTVGDVSRTWKRMKNRTSISYYTLGICNKIFFASREFCNYFEKIIAHDFPCIFSTVFLQYF